MTIRSLIVTQADLQKLQAAYPIMELLNELAQERLKVIVLERLLAEMERPDLPGNGATSSEILNESILRTLG